MIKTLTIASLVAASFAGSAFASSAHRRLPANADAFYATYEHRAAAPAASEAPAPAPAPREDFGSYGAGATARALGY